MYLLSLIINKLRRLAYLYFFRYLGFGCRVSPDVWNRQYSEGQWSKLTAPEEREHYDEVVSKALSLGNRRINILDLGCGDGALFGYFINNDGGDFYYRGVDLSQEAISMAKNKYKSVDFEVSDIEAYTSTLSYDVIILNESLYYLRRPLKEMKNLEKLLTSSGRFIISMCDYAGHDSIWSLLEENYSCLSKKNLINSRGQIWRVSEFLIK